MSRTWCPYREMVSGSSWSSFGQSKLVRLLLLRATALLLVPHHAATAEQPHFARRPSRCPDDEKVAEPRLVARLASAAVAASSTAAPPHAGLLRSDQPPRHPRSDPARPTCASPSCPRSPPARPPLPTARAAPAPFWDDVRTALEPSDRRGASPRSSSARSIIAPRRSSACPLPSCVASAKIPQGRNARAGAILVDASDGKSHRVVLPRRSQETERIKVFSPLLGRISAIFP